MSQMNPPQAWGAQVPENILELRAAEQRRRMHNTVNDLRRTVSERANVKKLARGYVWQATGIAAVVGLLAGYGTAGIFVR